MTNDNAGNVDRVWELMNKIGFAMLVTRDGAAAPTTLTVTLADYY